MKTIKKLQDQIEAQGKSVQRLAQDYETTQQVIDNANAHAAAVEELKKQRRRALAEALISKKTANTSTIDARISNEEALHESAQKSAATARDTLEVIAEGQRIAEVELEDLKTRLRDTICDEIVAQHDAARDRYVAAVVALEEAVAGMVAAERAWHCARPAIGAVDFPARGIQVLSDIREKGLRVPHTASRLADPKVASEYTPDYPNYWYLPTWADPKTEGFSDQQTCDFVKMLRTAGVECTDPLLARVAERQLKVRILRGTVSTGIKVLRDARTDTVISSKLAETFGPDEDIYLDESTARNLQAKRVVAVHGEDEMPEPKPGITSARVIDASAPPEDKRAGYRVGPVTREYAGNFFSLDMSSY
ncbi:hypothetical protein [Pandoraea sp.]|uniref:hypothetical protein n=1 Tax=Pandoraea sp. TaxID=1883445 RepID=UPI0035ADA591